MSLLLKPYNRDVLASLLFEKEKFRTTFSRPTDDVTYTFLRFYV